MNLFQQDRCLICHEIITPTVGWQALFSAEKEHHLCPTCKGRFEKIHGETCRICSRPFRNMEERFRDHDLCHDCSRWEEDAEWQGYLEKNTSLFLYNDFLKEVIARYKFRGDYVLAKAFADSIKEALGKMEADLYVPIPLSDVRLHERGFNQAEALLLEADITPAVILSRIHSEKQSKKTRAERIHLPQVFDVDKQIIVQGKKIVLIDDIYTTGSTLRHAAKILKGGGALSIQSLTLAR